MQHYEGVSAPWVGPSGGVSLTVLKDLIAQVSALLSAYPGIPEHVLGVRMQHALGRAHLRLLLQVMCEDNQVRCSTVPACSTCLLPHVAEDVSEGASTFVPVVGGLVLGIFIGALQCECKKRCCLTLVLPFQHHYFSDAASRMARYLLVGCCLSHI